MHSKLMVPRSIRYLLAVAENHSFTRAAEALHVSQPTLSQQIKLLEEALDAQLLDRSGRTVRLTEAGEVYARHARRALEELDAAKRAVVELEDLSRGFLRLGMTPITEYLTTSLLEDFSARYPGIVISAMEMSQDQIEAGVAESTLDAGIAFTHRSATELWSSKIEMHTLFVEPLSLAVGAGHPLAGQKAPVGIEVLRSEPMVLLNENFALRRHFDLYCLEHGVRPKIAVETNSLSMMIQSVGLGRLVTADDHRLHPARAVCRHLAAGVAQPHDRADRPQGYLSQPGVPGLRQAGRRMELRALADFARLRAHCGAGRAEDGAQAARSAYRGPTGVADARSGALGERSPEHFDHAAANIDTDPRGRFERTNLHQGRAPHGVTLLDAPAALGGRKDLVRDQVVGEEGRAVARGRILAHAVGLEEETRGNIVPG